MIRKKDLLKRIEEQEKEIENLRYKLRLLFSHLKLFVIDIPATPSQKKIVTEEEYAKIIDTGGISTLSQMQMTQKAYSNSARAFQEAKLEQK